MRSVRFHPAGLVVLALLGVPGVASADELPASGEPEATSETRDGSGDAADEAGTAEPTGDAADGPVAPTQPTRDPIRDRDGYLPDDADDGEAPQRDYLRHPDAEPDWEPPHTRDLRYGVWGSPGYQHPAPPPWARREGWDHPRAHDHGFLLRLSLGPSISSTRILVDGEEQTFIGLGSDVNLAIGGIVTPGLALHATIFGFGVDDTDLQIRGRDYSQPGLSFGMAALGFGVTWFVDPINLYVSASVGAASLDFSDGDERYDDDGFFEKTYRARGGAAVDLTIGKEWWLTDGWGMGLALGYSGHRVSSDSDLVGSFTGNSFSLRFSTTIN